MATKKKDPATVMMENLPKPNLSPSGTGAVSTPSAPVPTKQRIDLTNDAGFAQRAVNANNQMNKVKFSDFQRDSKGNITGVNLGGKLYEGSYETIVPLIQKWKQNNPLLAVDNTRSEMQAELDRSNLKKQMEQAQSVGYASPEQLSQVGQLDQAILNEPNDLTEDVMRKADLRKQESLLTADRATVGNVLSPILSPNKISGSLEGTKIGGIVFNLAGQNEKIREYLEDYKADDEYTLIKSKISDAESVMKASITQAKRGIDKDDALKNYNAAWTRIAVAEQQLKVIAQSDPRDWADSVRNEQILVHEMLYGDYKRQMDQNMAMSLNMKPDPNYDPFNNQEVQYGGN